MTDNAASTTIALDPAGRIAQDLHCIHCGYNLRTLSPEQACPECNRPVKPSLDGRLLQFADPSWLAGLVSGMNWIIAGFVAWLFDTMALPWLVIWLFPGNLRPWQVLAYRAIALLTCLVPVIGAWKVTSPEPYLRGAAWRASARWMARWLLAASIVALAGWHISLHAGHPGPFWYISIGDALRIIGVAGWVAFCIYLAGLARRIPATRLARAALIAAALFVLIEIAMLASVCAAHWFRYDQALAIRLLGPKYQLHLNLVQSFGDLSHQLLLLLLAILYRRFLRRQPQLVQRSTREPDFASRRSLKEVP